MSETSELKEIGFGEALKIVESWDVPLAEIGQEICECGEELVIQKQISGVFDSTRYHSHISGVLLYCPHCHRAYKSITENSWVVD